VTPDAAINVDFSYGPRPDLKVGDVVKVKCGEGRGLYRIDAVSPEGNYSMTYLGESK